MEQIGFWNGFKIMKERSELRLGSAFFGISDPGLVKKTFFKVFFPKKLTRASEDEILMIFFEDHHFSKISKFFEDLQKLSRIAHAPISTP